METRTYPSVMEMQDYIIKSHSYCGAMNDLIKQGVLKEVKPDEELLKQGFYKVDEDGRSYQHCVCLNPQTMEVFRVLEWDYEDIRVDDNLYRHTSINYNSEAFLLWWDLIYRNDYEESKRIEKEIEERLAKQPQVGDKAIVVRGRTLPKGTIGTVTKIWYYQASYYNKVAYALLDSGERIALKNLEKYND